jgi:glyoxylase-like metal-dependent hydrolase (beta-lactamase superfamily II)
MMETKINRIELAMPLRMGSVNCYLLEAASGFVLIDTGNSANRKTLLQELECTGCTPGKLKLILLTHGDFDHTGNAAYLRSMYKAPVAMHAGDVPMGETGDMFANRKKPNRLIRALVPLFTGFRKTERFTPDVLVEDGSALSGYGIDARILSIPGHSKGSIGILSARNELFCGDLLQNTQKPAPTSLVDDADQLSASIQRLNEMEVGSVYPGHGKPFRLSELKLVR